MTGIDPSRILVKQYDMKEGILELRPGISDLDLGERKWAQVRIFLGASDHYIKGMAIYSEEIPDGFDIVFYTRIKDNGTFAGYGTLKRHEKHGTLMIVQNDGGDWPTWENSLRKEFPNVKHD